MPVSYRDKWSHGRRAGTNEPKHGHVGGGYGPITYQRHEMPQGGVGRGGGPPPPSLVGPTMPRGERRGPSIKQRERQAGLSHHESRPRETLRSL